MPQTKKQQRAYLSQTRAEELAAELTDETGIPHVSESMPYLPRYWQVRQSDRHCNLCGARLVSTFSGRCCETGLPHGIHLAGESQKQDERDGFPVSIGRPGAKIGADLARHFKIARKLYATN